jgi:hypothetical protein
VKPLTVGFSFDIAACSGQPKMRVALGSALNVDFYDIVLRAFFVHCEDAIGSCNCRAQGSSWQPGGTDPKDGGSVVANRQADCGFDDDGMVLQ